VPERFRTVAPSAPSVVLAISAPTISPAQFDWGNRGHRTPSDKGAPSATLRRVTDGGAESRARVAIIGAGTMGAGIAQVALEAGWVVTLHDPLAGATDRARARILDGLQRRAAKTGVDSDAAEAWAMGRVEGLTVAGTAAAAAEEAHLVIEAAIEDLVAKQALVGELDRAASPTTVLATNTSALSVARIAEGARIAPERVVGMHFFNPAPVLHLVEIVAAKGSAAWAVERAAAIADDWGKTPIRSTDSRPSSRPMHTTALS